MTGSQREAAELLAKMDAEPELYAELRKVGRWTWWILLRAKDRIDFDDTGWHCLGSRERAERKAQRKLAKVIRERRRWNDVYRVLPADPTNT